MNPIIVKSNKNIDAEAIRRRKTEIEDEPNTRAIEMKEKRVEAWTSFVVGIVNGKCARAHFRVDSVEISVCDRAAQIGHCLEMNVCNISVSKNPSQNQHTHEETEKETKDKPNGSNSIRKWTIFFDLSQTHDCYHHWNIKANFINISIEWFFWCVFQPTLNRVRERRKEEKNRDAYNVDSCFSLKIIPFSALNIVAKRMMWIIKSVKRTVNGNIVSQFWVFFLHVTKIHRTLADLIYQQLCIKV